MRLTLKALTAVIAIAVLAAVAAPQPAQAKRGKIPVLIQVTNNTTGDVDEPRLRSEKAELITFTSDGDVEVQGVTPGQREVYAWFRNPNILQRVTTTPGGESFNASRSTDQTFAHTEEFVAFVSTGDFDPEVDNSDGNAEIFMWFRNSGLIRQVTDTPVGVTNLDPYPSDSGKCMVFTSNGDLEDNDGSDDKNPSPGFSNPDGSREVFLFSSLDGGSIYPRSRQITQITNGPVGTTSSRPVIGGYWFPRQCQSTAYMSDHDQLGNGAVGTHIYVYNRQAASSEQMTAQEIPDGLLDGDYMFPHISSASNFARGPYTVFHTGVDLWRNASVGMNVFRYRIFHPRMTQYTDQNLGDAKSPVISDGGKWIALHSDGELVQHVKKKAAHQPPYNADGNEEIFRLQGRNKVQQITETVGCENTQPSIEDTGVSIAFRSTCDLVPGNNPSGVPQVFFYTQVRDDDPLSNSSGCLVANGCCNEANGCYTKIDGKSDKVTKKQCLKKKRGCS